MSDVTLGQLTTIDTPRDAIHVAVIPMKAATDLDAGSPVNQHGWKSDYAPVGIVDPFLTRVVKKGEVFWCMLYPKSIVGMRHHWVHPAFPSETEKGFPFTPEESKAWLEAFCRTQDCPDYDTVVAAALGEYVEPIEWYGSEAYSIQDYGDGDIYLFFSGRDAHSSIPPEFWDHVENATGKKCPVRATTFSCSC